MKKMNKKIDIRFKKAVGRFNDAISYWNNKIIKKMAQEIEPYLTKILRIANLCNQWF